MSEQKPLELILARNLLTSVSTPAFLVDRQATLLFFNESAAAMVGRHFEETGSMPASEWTREFGPFDEHDQPLPVDQLPLTVALRDGRPSHDTFRIRNVSGNCHDVAASAVPIVGSDRSSGAIVFFWPLQPESQAEGE